MTETVHITAALVYNPTRWRWSVVTNDGEWLADFVDASSALRWIANATSGASRAHHGEASIVVAVPSVEWLRSSLPTSGGPLRHPKLGI